MTEDNHNVRAAEMEMFSSACRLGKVFDKYNSNIKNTYFIFSPLHFFLFYYFCGVDV